jgi:hypothetical protein
MKRAILLVALLAGCDDESLPARVAAAQIHGIVEAQADCECELTNTVSSATTTINPYLAQRLLDGSCFVTWSSTPRLTARSESGAESCRGVVGAATLDLVDGVFSFQNGPGAGNLWEGPATTSCCTGFNLAAFGVE